jgi:hypothetical protein
VERRREDTRYKMIRVHSETWDLLKSVRETDYEPWDHLLRRLATTVRGPK